MRERTAGLIKSLLLTFLRALLPPHGQHRATLPQSPVIQQWSAPPARHPAHICPCERERILQHRRAHWSASYGTEANLRGSHAEEVSA